MSGIKRRIVVIICVAFCFALSACGKVEPLTTTAAETTTRKPATTHTSETFATAPIIHEYRGENYTGVLYATPYGERYHYLPDCGGKNSREITHAQASARGLAPCQKCVGGY